MFVIMSVHVAVLHLFRFLRFPRILRDIARLVMILVQVVLQWRTDG